MKIEIKINNEEETKKLAKIISEYCSKGTLIALNGELGAGKTFFTKELGRIMGVTHTITSPTFNILKCYDGKLPFYHIDAYRLENIKQDLGLEEFLEGDGVCLVEWADFLLYLFPEEYLNISIYINEDTTRKFVIESFGSKYDEIVKGVEESWR